MQQIFLKGIPILSAASISSYILYYKTNSYSHAYAETTDPYLYSFETPERYFQPLFETQTKDIISPPKEKKMLLTSSEIIDKLKGNEDTIHLSNNNTITHYQINQYNANNPIEDTYDIRTKLNTKNLHGMLFGVFDGHSGSDCSKFCQNELLDFIEYSASTSGIDQKQNQNNAVTDELTCLSPSNYNDFAYYRDNYMLPFTRSFLLADTAYLFSLSNSTKDIKKATGSCAIVCHLDEIYNNNTNTFDKWITTSWCGDCRAIIGQKIYNQYTNKYEWKCIQLTLDHQIDINPKERLRLLNEHPNEKDIIYRNRVKGRLQPTRVFGDGHYKYMKFFLNWKNKIKYMNSSTWTPPYVTAKPDISCYKLMSNDNQKDMFMIISTDGLFQDLRNDEIIQYVGNIIDNNNNINSDNISTLLIQKALLSASRYFNGKLNTNEMNLSSILNLDPKHKRSVHDDITILTLFFNNDNNNLNKDKNKINKGKDPKMPDTLKQLLTQNAQSKL